MDAGPDEPNLSLKWHLRIFLLLKMPGDPRHKIKRLISEADKCKANGYYDEALNLYRTASSIAKELKIHYLQKVLVKRMGTLELIADALPRTESNKSTHFSTLDKVIVNLADQEIPKNNL